MAFDPDEFLAGSASAEAAAGLAVEEGPASGVAFDPDAFLAGSAPAERQEAFDPDAFLAGEAVKDGERGILGTTWEGAKLFAGQVLESLGTALEGVGRVAERVTNPLAWVGLDKSLVESGLKVIEDESGMEARAAAEARIAADQGRTAAKALEDVGSAVKGKVAEDVSGSFAGTAAQFAGDVGTGLALTVTPAGWPAAMTYFAGLAGERGAQEAIAAGRPELADEARMVNGAIALAANAVPVGRLSQMLKGSGVNPFVKKLGEGVVKELTRPDRRKALWVAAEEAFKQGGINAAAGAADQMGRNVYAGWRYDPERGLMDFVPEAALGAGVIAMPFGAYAGTLRLPQMARAEAARRAAVREGAVDVDGVMPGRGGRGGDAALGVMESGPMVPGGGAGGAGARSVVPSGVMFQARSGVVESLQPGGDNVEQAQGEVVKADGGMSGVSDGGAVGEAEPGAGGVVAAGVPRPATAGKGQAGFAFASGGAAGEVGVRGVAWPANPAGFDVLDFIVEQGGMIAPGKLKKSPERWERLKSEYDDMPVLSGIYNRLIGGELAPDQMAALAAERGFGDGSVVGLWREVDRAMTGRAKWKGQEAEMRKVARDENAAAEAAERLRKRQALLWKGEVVEGDGPVVVPVSGLAVGDVLVTDGGLVSVTGVDPDGVVTLTSEVYGEQRVAEGVSLRALEVQKGNRVDAAGDDPFDVGPGGAFGLTPAAERAAWLAALGPENEIGIAEGHAVKGWRGKVPIRFLVREQETVEPEGVENYRRQIEAGMMPDEIVVAAMMDGVWVVFDGNHRYEGAKLAGLTEIDAFIFKPENNRKVGGADAGNEYIFKFEMQDEARFQLVLGSIENRPFAGADDGSGNAADVGNVERGADGRVQPAANAKGEGTGTDLGRGQAADRGATAGGVPVPLNPVVFVTPSKSGALPALRPVEFGGWEHVRAVAMPELVKLATMLGGEAPRVSKLRNARGVFRQGGPEIVMDWAVFADPVQASKTMAHEIGHWFSLLGDLGGEKTMARGNLFGHLAALDNFLGTTLPKLPGGGESLTAKDRARLRNQALREIGATYGPRPDKDDVVARALWNGEVSKRYAKLVNDEIEKRGLVKESEVRSELEELSKVWRGDWVGTDDAYVEYRRSAKELYADAVSVLFNDPQYLADVAPTFYRMWWSYLDKRPEVKQAVFTIQDLLHRPIEVVIADRSERRRAGYQKGDAIFRAKWEEMQSQAFTWQGWLSQLKQETFNVFDPIIKRQRKVEALRGGFLPDKQRPDWFFNAHPLGENKVFLKLTNMQTKVLDPILERGMDRTVLGEYLELNRIANEWYDVVDKDGVVSKAGRAGLANPGGESPGTARAALMVMRRKLGADNWATLEAAARRFQDEVFQVMGDAVDAGVISRKMFEGGLNQNRYNYAAFVPLKYWDRYVPATIRKQVGTLDDVANPFDATVLKTVSFIQAANRNRAMTFVRDFLSQYYPSEIRPAELLWDGNKQVPKEPTEVGWGLLEVREDGVLRGYYVPEEIVGMFDRVGPEAAWASVRVLGKAFREVIYPMLIRYNPGFQLVASPIMDIQRTLVNMPDGLRVKVVRQLVKDLYAMAFKPKVSVSRIRQGIVFGDHAKLAKPGPDATPEEIEAWRLTMEMMHVRALWTPFESFARDVASTVSPFDEMLRKFHYLPDVERNKFLNFAVVKPVAKALRWVEYIGQMLEAWNKVAAYKVLTRDAKWTPEQAGVYVMDHIGVSNFFKRGKQAWAINSFFPFWTVATNGLESDARLIRGQVKGKSGANWLLGWMLFGGAYALMQSLAEEGAFGEDLQRWFAGTSEYDRMVSLIIPLGSKVGGEYGQKVQYFRLPQDESNRILNGLMRYGVKAAFRVGRGEEVDEHWEAFGFLSGQLPGLNPVLSAGAGWATFLSGANPTDGNRNAYVLSRAEQSTRGIEAWMTMAGFTADKLGVTNFLKYDRRAETFGEFLVSAMPVLNRVFRVTDAGYRSQQYANEGEMDRAGYARRLAQAGSVQQLATEYFALTGLRRENRSVDQEERMFQLRVWHRSIYAPMMEMWDEATPEQRKIIRARLQAASEPFRR